MTDYLDRQIGLDEIADAFGELTFWASRFGALMLDELPLASDATVLDLGCATGFPLFELAHVLGPRSRVVGADVWLRALAHAERRRVIYRLPNAALAGGDGAALPFRGGSFGMVVSNLGVNNFADPDAVLAECARVLKPGGTFALTTNVAGHMREVYEVLRSVAEDAGDAGAVERLAADEARRGTDESVRARVERAGLRVRRMVRDTFELRYASGGALLRHWLTMIGFLPSWRAALGADRERELLAEAERRLDALSAERGELRATVPMLYLEAERPG
ncbi:MAG TPA: class I SAM-dependent methyltransferase [Longimicrobium sp.]|nr:class I SAM-dependent methyltransferase [Longimicrobium sp.]